MTLVRQHGGEADSTKASDRSGKPIKAEAVEVPPGINLQVRTTASGFLSGEVFIAGISKPLNFIIDTGATVTVLSEKLAALEEAQPFIKPSRMRVFGAAGVADDVKMALLPKLLVGSYTREKVDAAVLDLDPVNETAGFLQSGILGGNFLRFYRVVFDFYKGVVRLEPLDTQGLSTGSPTPEGTR